MAMSAVTAWVNTIKKVHSSVYCLQPEESMQIQSNLASTIAMAFDECPSSVADRVYMEQSVDRTTRWLRR